MKVLMLGWEFPPRVSGGLGSACAGMVRGLAHHGVDVLFVMPRIVAGGRGEANELVPEVVPGSAVARSLELLSVDSALRPYLDDPGYVERLEQVLSQRRRRRNAPRTSFGPYRPHDVEPPAWARPFVGERQEPEAWRAVRHGAANALYGPGLTQEVERFAHRVGRIARARRFDLIHANDWMTWPAGLLAREVAHKPLVCHVHACEYDRKGDRGDGTIRSIERLGFESADRTVCVSRFSADTVERRYGVDPERLRVVHNGVDAPTTPAPARRKAPTVLFLGRMTLQKGPDYFLEAAAVVARRAPDVRFVMAGDGELRGHLERRAAELGLADRVDFPGFVEGNELEQVYANASCLVMPSVSEPFGLVALEGMIRDVPVVLSRQSGAAEAVRSVLRVDFWRTDELAAKVLSVLRFPALGRQLVEDAHREARALSWERQAATLLGVYRELVA